MKYFVRTTGERALDSSFSQVPYELLLDKEHKFVDIIVDQLEYINQYDSFLFEDDVILCKDFINVSNEIISKYPNKIINFFSPQQITPKETEVCHSFIWNQCTYYPKGSFTDIIPTLKKLIATTDKNSWIYTVGHLIANSFSRHKVEMIDYRPSIVQHKDIKSLINHKSGLSRIDLYFIDYIKELNLEYDCKVLPKYKKDLVNIRNREYNKWLKELGNK